MSCEGAQERLTDLDVKLTMRGLPGASGTSTKKNTLLLQKHEGSYIPKKNGHIISSDFAICRLFVRKSHKPIKCTGWSNRRKRRAARKTES